MNLSLFDTDGTRFEERKPDFPNMTQPSENRYTGETPSMPLRPSLAMAYVPFQQWGNTMQPNEALESGTLFSDLVFPFEEVGK